MKINWYYSDFVAVYQARVVVILQAMEIFERHYIIFTFIFKQIIFRNLHNLLCFFG